MSANQSFSIRVRPYTPADQSFVFSQAPRLLIGTSSWRDSKKILTAIHQWLTNSTEQHGIRTMVFIAENEQGKRLGFASVSHSTHFSGEKQAYIGELVVDETVEGSGVGQALVEACEQWAISHGYTYLVLETGAANKRARGFYQHLGFMEEDIKLVKQLENVKSSR